jgi:flagellar basal body-associated protein FliL
MKLSRITVAVIFIILFMIAGCNKDESEEVRIPDYPGAVEDQSYNMGDMARVKRLLTSDSYEAVLSFYKEELKQYDPEIRSYVLEDSRQTELNVVKEEKRVISVVVQEFEGEDKVAIVHMGVSL